MTIEAMTQQEIERLLKESQEIANDWDTYTQFRKNRDAVLSRLMAEEGLN